MQQQDCDLALTTGAAAAFVNTSSVTMATSYTNDVRVIVIVENKADIVTGAGIIALG